MEEREMGPELGLVPKMTDRQPQRDKLPCESGMADKAKRQEGVPFCSGDTRRDRYLPGKTGRTPKDSPPCESSMVQGKLGRKEQHQEQSGVRILERMDALEETTGATAT
ncbi:hypothetical protein B7P43_G08360 [Cryptotermes secundus]|uniref:Uncharacterized protein n=1 Tax=Cryptotermes secundus TaxID=105785 RepID=A0A2J7Q8S6_9NEOP|nr:hypothetical protein B7P43_G08360 [Cryptotermes secundus]